MELFFFFFQKFALLCLSSLPVSILIPALRGLSKKRGLSGTHKRVAVEVKLAKRSGSLFCKQSITGLSGPGSIGDFPPAEGGLLQSRH